MNKGRLRGKRNIVLKPKKKINKLKMKNLKGEVSIFGEEKKQGTKLRAKPPRSAAKIHEKKEEKNVFYSDGLQILNDMSDKREEKKEENRLDLINKINSNQEKILKQKEKNARGTQERFIEQAMRQEDIEDNLRMKERAKEFVRLKKWKKWKKRAKLPKMLRYKN